MRSSATYCVDTGIVVRAHQPDFPEVHALWDDWRRSNATLVAPGLLRYELTNAFYRIARAGNHDEALLHRTLQRAFAMRIVYHDDPALHQEAARIASRFGLPATYDAHYLALAQRLGVEFLTTDARLAKAVGDSLPWVRLVAAG